MDKTPFTQVIANLHAQGDGYRVTLPADWLQGRTAYGGLVAAIGLEATLRAVPNLPPIRSAQVSFIGPSGDELEITVQVLRRGRSVVFVECTLSNERGMVARCLFCFGAARPSGLAAPVFTPPKFLPPETSSESISFEEAPAFVRHYETRVLSGGPPGSCSAKPELLVWVRHGDRDAHGSMVGLLGLADMLPPAILSTLPRFVPISSMTWQIDFFVSESPDDDGWRLLEATAESATEGYSSQRMAIWDRQGRPLMASRQSLAIFDR
ncbi:MAG: thioesterase family protein [Myxococcota bacterium]|nr:thioesterase family protein [Myxococcota bacterium]